MVGKDGKGGHVILVIKQYLAVPYCAAYYYSVSIMEEEKKKGSTAHTYPHSTVHTAYYVARRDVPGFQTVGIICSPVCLPGPLLFPQHHHMCKGRTTKQSRPPLPRFTFLVGIRSVSIDSVGPTATAAGGRTIALRGQTPSAPVERARASWYMHRSFC